MKTKDELAKLAFKIAGLVDEMKSQEASQLLDALHSEGMTDAAKVVHGGLNRCHIYTAITRKPKISSLASKTLALPNTEVAAKA